MRRTRACVAFMAALAGVAFVTEARAQADDPPAPRAQELANGGAEISFGTLFFQPSLRDEHFDGRGTPLDKPPPTTPESFHHKGRELGIDSPLMWGAELSFHYMRRYFAIGVMGFLAGHPGAADAVPIPADGIAASQVNPGAITGYGAGIDLAGAVPLGMIALRPGVVVGVRGFSVPMIGFEQTTCQGTRSGSHSCYEDATTDPLLFVEPRVRMAITPPRSVLSFGAYVGIEVVGGSGPTAGLFLSGTMNAHENLRP